MFTMFRVDTSNHAENQFFSMGGIGALRLIYIFLFKRHGSIVGFERKTNVMLVHIQASEVGVEEPRLFIFRLTPEKVTFQIR